jgi:polyphosphate kinase 2 (PPK2 family)
MSRSKSIKLSSVARALRIDESDYQERLKKLQHRLSLVQQAYLTQKRNAVLVFEGVDAAGKGGLIRRLAWALDPRGFRVWPIAAPTELERKEHYLQRFWNKLPPRGTIAAFDRSWYGRVLVERVERLTPKPDWSRAYREIREFERTLSDNGCRVIKTFLHIDQNEQAKRFRDRLKDPDKRWKLSFEDFRNREHWNHYIRAFEDMFAETSTPYAPWKVVANNNKHAARLEAIEDIVEKLGRGISLKAPKPNKKLQNLTQTL